MSSYPTIKYSHGNSCSMVADSDISAIMAMADLSASKGDYDRSMVLLKNALNQIDKSSGGDLRQRLDIMMRLAETNHVTGQWVDALMYLDNVYQTASEKNLRAVMAEALLVSGTILSKKGKWNLAQKKFDQAISIAGSEAHRSIVARALIGKGIISWRGGAGQEAIILARKAMSMEGISDEDNVVGSAQALIASAAFDMGDYTLSLDSNEKALTHFRKAGNSIEIARILNNTGETHKVMGNYYKALDCFNEGLKLAGSGALRSLGYLLTNIAECHARQGQAAEARRFADMASEKILGVQDDYLHAMLSFVWALIHESEQNHPEAIEAHVKAIEKMKALAIPFDMGMMQLAYARYLAGLEKYEAAAKALDEAKSSFKSSGSAFMLEETKKELAKFSARKVP